MIWCGARPTRDILKRDRTGAGLHEAGQGTQNVLLPAPLAPMRLIISPASRWKDTLDGFYSAVMHPQIAHLKHRHPAPR
jgi:hypothetical protein